jgi:hypothetical protein
MSGYYEAAFGIVDDTGKVCGAFWFNNYNFSDIELHYYGPGTLKRYIVVEICARVLAMFRINRMTLRAKSGGMGRGFEGLGAHFEGVQRRFLGPTDEDKHAVWVYGLYREQIEKIARMSDVVSRCT